jgi:membrane protease YdiL (CAAX protease family)
VEPVARVRKRYVAGLLIVLVSEYAIRIVLLSGGTAPARVGIAMILEWLVLALLLVVWLPRVEHLGPGSIGFGAFKLRHVWLAVLAYVAATALFVLTGFLLPTVGLSPIGSLQPMLAELGFPVLLGLFLTGTLLEEIFYRGYLIERLISLIGRPVIAGAASWLAFSAVHIVFFGLGPTIDVSILAAALVALYLKERSIWPCILLHGLNNAFAYLIVPLLLNLRP